MGIESQRSPSGIRCQLYFFQILQFARRPSHDGEVRKDEGWRWRMKKQRNYTPLNARMLKQNEIVPLDKEDVIYPEFKMLRGSPQYWMRPNRDFFATLRQLGEPTFISINFRGIFQTARSKSINHGRTTRAGLLFVSQSWSIMVEFPLLLSGLDNFRWATSFPCKAPWQLLGNVVPLDCWVVHQTNESESL